MSTLHGRLRPQKVSTGMPPNDKPQGNKAPKAANTAPPIKVDAPPIGPAGAETGLSEQHFDRNAARYGRWMMIGSAVAFVFVTSLIAAFAAMMRQELATQSALSMIYTMSLGVQAAAPFVFVGGVLLYCFGRFLASGSITLIGFEGASPQDIAVVGPDEQNVVWIGRRFNARIDAEAAREALARRFRPNPS